MKFLKKKLFKIYIKMNYKTFLTCNKYIHFTKAKERSILTGNAEKEREKNTVWFHVLLSV